MSSQVMYLMSLTSNVSELKELKTNYEVYRRQMDDLEVLVKSRDETITQLEAIHLLRDQKQRTGPSH